MKIILILLFSSALPNAAFSQAIVLFNTQQIIILPINAMPSDIAVADFNHDGSPDITLSERGLN